MTGKTIRLTAGQAMVKWLCVQMTEDGERFIEGVWAIFGHGNVCGLGEALEQSRDDMPTWRGQNEQTMAHIAIAFGKACKRKRAMAVTTSIGPGATNLVTAAGLAHVNRLPLLLIPGDTFAHRRPDPVLQQIEDFDDGTITANDCLRPVSRYFDRITRPEHIITALPRAFAAMTDPATCGPATLSFCQDVQGEAYDFPEEFFAPRIWHIRRPEPDSGELERVTKMISDAKSPVIVAGGGAIYSEAEEVLGDFATKHNIPIVETQSGKGAVAQAHAMNCGASGVDGSAAANAVAKGADLIIGVGTRFQDFVTGSWALFSNPERRLVSINVAAYDAMKHGAVPLMGDAKIALEKLTGALGDYKATNFEPKLRQEWLEAVNVYCSAREGGEGYRPLDCEVIGAVQRTSDPSTVAMCAAGTMPGALKLLWQASKGGYHMEYGFSCMGYEIAGALGLKLALPDRDIVCFLGDGSYMLANSELATAVMRKVPFTVVLTNNRGYGCIHRLQTGTGGAPFNNLYESCNIAEQPQIDYVAHAASMGANAMQATDILDLEAKLKAAKGSDIPTVIVIETNPNPGPVFGNAGHWWDVGLPVVSTQESKKQAYKAYLEGKKRQRLVN